MKVNYVSDLHVDNWVVVTKSQDKTKENVRKWVQALLANTEELHEVLLFGGDMSNLNWISLVAFEELSKHFKQIIMVHGNHEYYLDSKSQKKKYGSSAVRVEELESLLPQNIHVLKDFVPFEYDGIVFAGDTAWYPVQTEEEQYFFHHISNDSKDIRGIYIPDKYEETLHHYKHLEQVDVLLTHVPPIALTENKYNNACYLCPLPTAKAPVWLFGHTHHKQFRQERDGTLYVSHAIGYKELDIKHEPANETYDDYKRKKKEAEKSLLKEVKLLSLTINGGLLHEHTKNETNDCKVVSGK